MSLNYVVSSKVVVLKDVEVNLFHVTPSPANLIIETQFVHGRRQTIGHQGCSFQSEILYEHDYTFFHQDSIWFKIQDSN